MEGVWEVTGQVVREGGEEVTGGAGLEVGVQIEV